MLAAAVATKEKGISKQISAYAQSSEKHNFE